MKKKIFKIIYISIFSVLVLESAYLFVVPVFLNKYINEAYIESVSAQKTNVIISCKNSKIKTHILPYLSFSLSNLIIKDKQNGDIILNGENLSAKIALFPLIRKKINIKSSAADNIEIFITKDENGIYNFLELFPSNDKKGFKTECKNTNLLLNRLQITENDKSFNTVSVLNTDKLKINIKKSFISVITQGTITNNDYKSDFDINISFKYPNQIKHFEIPTAAGSCILYNIHLNRLFPYIQKYLNKNITEIDGTVDFIQISAGQNSDKENEISINTRFNDVKYSQKDWEKGINAEGETKFDLTAVLNQNTINIKSLNYKADNINIKTGGAITLEKKPTLDIWAEVKDSKAEKIAEILPPCITKELKTIEKIKHYGVFGDIEASVKAQGAIPQPDITGYVKGKNVKILDKKFHKYHTGSVNIKFDKRILNMDILINMLNNQKAFIKGYVYMFRDGINNVTINTTDNINFAIAQKLVVPISKVFNFQLGPIPDMDIKNGYGVINVNVKGSPDYLSINGYSKFDNADLTYNGLYGEIQNGKGALEFNEDVISFESERAFVKNNPLKVKGSVKINDNLNFDISSDSAAAENLLEIINNSDLLKDVKAGLVVINKAAGLTKLFVNIKAKIVPVPFGQPPLPPEEAFYDMKVKGSLELLEDSCYLEGFYTPLENVKGTVDFTEETVVLNNLNAISGTSNLDISGKIITDLKTKIPDVDIEVKSKEVNLKDTIKFLTQSYLYPSNYPDLSCLYEIPLKHDLYFKYKAKAIDFITDKAYAKMNFIEDNNNNPIKAQSGTVILDKSTVTIENAAAYIYDSIIKVKGNVQKVDTLNPIYNLDIISENFNLENLNNPEEIEILPQQAVNIVKEFKDFKGLADINLQLKKNIFSGKIKLTKPQIRHAQTNLPVFFDDFDISLDNNKISIDNFTALIEDMPVYGNIKVSDIYSKMPDIDGYFTSKITNSIIKNYMPSKFAEKLELYGDVNFSVKLKGNEENLKIYPKLTLYPDSDIEYEKINLGDVNNKREFSGDINFYENKVKINKFDYTKYISSQNNAVFPIVFAKMQGEFNIIDNNTIEPIEISLKTNKNVSARILNLLIKNHIFAQGALNCDLKYKFDKLTKAAKLIGNIECRNIDIPLLDSVIKNIRIEAKEDNIDLKVFGFISDSRINVHSLLENNLSKIPEIYLLELFADKLDKDNLIKNAAYIHKTTEENNERKNIELPNICLNKGHFNVKQFIIKSLNVNNFTGDFSIDKNGIFNAENVNAEVGQGNMYGKFSYNLNNTDMNANFELNNVDSNYVAETLFDAKNQIYGSGSGKIILKTTGLTNEEIIKNLEGLVYFEIFDGRMPRLGSIEYLLRAGNIIKSGITGFTINSILELLNLVKTGYFSNINGGCIIENGVAKNIEIFSTGENMSLYIHGSYDIAQTNADMEILGKLSNKISTIFGAIGNTSLNTFFKLIPGISLLDFGRKNFIEDVEKIPSFTNGDYDSRVFQAIVRGNINSSNSVESFKWVK